MDNKFKVTFLKEAFDFLKSLEQKHSEKILYNIRKAQISQDPKLFKKLTDEIWEFRTLYKGIQYRLLAFWDKTTKDKTLVISTHGMIKKTGKVPKKEITKAITSRAEYFQKKNKNK